MTTDLSALCPLDGRYAPRIVELRPIFSEYGLIRNRVRVEVAWLRALCGCPEIKEARPLNGEEESFLKAIVKQFSEDDAERIKEIERTTNHDVKAVEYYLKERLEDTSMDGLREFIHFACTSEDINNLSHGLQIKEGLEVLKRAQAQISEALASMAREFRSVPMLSRTHGQTASPSTVGKELAVFVARLRRQSAQLDQIAILGKINGAVGNFNAHAAAYPKVDWIELTRSVIEDELGLHQNLFTIQIEPHDYMAELFDALARWNTVLLDLDRDVWTYISLGYFGQRAIKGEVGSSTMPHKVNPIDFENSEGNIGIANALFEHLSRKLPVSRLQRDLTDSTVLRNVGVGFGYCLVAYKSATKGLSKLKISLAALEHDLDDAWEVMAEPIQTLMRKAGIPNPYEKLKDLTRGRRISEDTIRSFISTLDLDEADKRRLLEMTPSSYTGLAAELVDRL